MTEPQAFDPNCRACPRLAAFLERVRADRPDYFAAPVPGFGDPRAHLLVVGLAPGMHGANRTGRPFTGDHAGILLYQTLFDLGFANQPNGDDPDDGLQLRDARVINAVRCLPPENKPTGAEVRQCNGFLRHDLDAAPGGAAIVTLGQVAHRAVLRALGLRQCDYPFGHGRDYQLARDRRLISSYHCSRYNTQTRRLTPAMFRDVFARARAHLDDTAHETR